MLSTETSGLRYVEGSAVLHDKTKKFDFLLTVLPLSAQVRDGAYHTFVIDDRRLVTIELFTGQPVLRDPKDIDHYWALFDFFSVHTLWADEARSVLKALADTFRTSK